MTGGHYIRLMLVWVFASSVVAIARIILTVALGVWTPDGRMVRSPLLFSALAGGQIAVTGVLTFLLMAGLVASHRKRVDKLRAEQPTLAIPDDDW